MDEHEQLKEVLERLQGLGARVPSFDVDHLSTHEAKIWLRSETARLEQFARVTWEQHA